jgi:hypothetical protein
MGFFFDKMARQIQGAFIFDESMYSQGVELLAYMDPHNALPFGVTQWDALPVNRGPPSFDEPYATEIFNTYFWPMICHTNMRRFLTPDYRPVEHQGFLAVFLDETGMGLQDDGWKSFLMGVILQERFYLMRAFLTWLPLNHEDEIPARVIHP